LKNLTIVLTLVSLFAISISVSSCSSCSNSAPNSPETMLEGTLPTEQSIAKQSTEQLTQPQTKAINPITVEEFVKNVLRDKYEEGDKIFVSGIVIHVQGDVSKTTGKMRIALILGPEANGYTVTFVSEGVAAESALEPGYASYMSMAKVEKGNKVVAQGDYDHSTQYDSDNTKTFVLRNASVQ